MLNKNSIQPLYKQLMDIITQQIKNGTYKPGEKIPPEPVENQKLTTGHLDEEDWGKLSLASSALSQTNLC